MGAEELRARLEDAARAVWPRSRRWRRFLRSLPLDPDALPRPLEPTGPHDFVICGVPRSGTSLLAAALYQPPRVVVAMEPWDGMRLPPAELFRSLRRELEETGTLRRQRLDVGAASEDGDVRWQSEGDRVERVALEGDWLLGVKWPGFWRYLEVLPQTRFLVCLRNPVEVVASFKRSGGYLARGLNYDTTFNRKMNAEMTRRSPRFAERRALLYQYVNERVVPHLGRPNVLAVRYERWFDDADALWTDISTFLSVDLEPPRPRIRRPVVPSLSDEELELVRTRCTVARELGYAVPGAPS